MTDCTVFLDLPISHYRSIFGLHRAGLNTGRHVGILEDKGGIDTYSLTGVFSGFLTSYLGQSIGLSQSSTHLKHFLLYNFSSVFLESSC